MINIHFLKILFIYFGRTACGILAPRPGIEPTARAVEVQSLNHWTAREVQYSFFFNFYKF